MANKNRLAQLEKTLGASTNTMRLELMKPSEIQARADAIRAGIIEKWDAVLMGEVLPVQPITKAGEAAKDEILRRLARIAKDGMT